MLFYSCFAPLGFFKHAMYKTLRHSNFFLTFFMWDLFSFDNVNPTSVKFHIVEYTWYDFILYSVHIVVYNCYDFILCSIHEDMYWA